jgi:mRNA interferase RelE/StbE
MAWQIIYHPLVAEEDLTRLPQDIKNRLRTAIEGRLSKEPLMAGKPLRQSLKGHRKMRVGDYRIIYRISGETIIILKIGHRKEVYFKVLKRLK